MPSIDGYLIVRRIAKNSWSRPRFETRWLEKKPKATLPSEVMVHVAVDIPDEIFERPQLYAKIVVTPDQVPPREIKKEVLIKASELLQAQTGFRVEFVLEPPIEQPAPATDPVKED